MKKQIIIALSALAIMVNTMNASNDPHKTGIYRNMSRDAMFLFMLDETFQFDKDEILQRLRTSKFSELAESELPDMLSKSENTGRSICSIINAYADNYSYEAKTSLLKQIFKDPTKGEYLAKACFEHNLSTKQ